MIRTLVAAVVLAVAAGSAQAQQPVCKDGKCPLLKKANPFAAQPFAAPAATPKPMPATAAPCVCGAACACKPGDCPAKCPVAAPKAAPVQAAKPVTYVYSWNGRKYVLTQIVR